MHPEVQAKAQAEIDAVVGSNRLPNFDDRPRLPYIDAMVKEVLRWNTVLSFGPSILLYLLMYDVMLQNSSACD